MGVHVFVDESKERSYLLTAAVLLPGDLSQVRRQLDELRLPGQRRLHFTKERDSRRRKILSVLARTGVEAVIYDASGYRNPAEARPACLDRLVRDCADRRAELLVLEQDDSVLASDRRALYTCVRKAGCGDTLRYEHRHGRHESLLAIPDAVAWCWARGGEWKQRVRPLVSAVHRV